MRCNRLGWDLLIVDRTGDTDARTGQRIVRRRDLLGIFDGLATTRDGGTIGLQWTSAGNALARAKKIRGSPHLNWLRQAGWAAIVWGFHGDGLRTREIPILRGTRHDGAALVDS